jgi:hypothetical protein
MTYLPCKIPESDNIELVLRLNDLQSSETGDLHGNQDRRFIAAARPKLFFFLVFCSIYVASKTASNVSYLYLNIRHFK